MQTAYRIERPTGVSQPVVLASPHSGDYYPDTLLRMSRLSLALLRRSEDAYVHELFRDGPVLGMPLIAATHARAYVDLNRAPYELDPAMFAEPLPSFAQPDTDRVAAGLGVLPRVAGIGLDIYTAKLPLAEAQQRIEYIYRPYHNALKSLVEETRSEHGYAVLLDCHSMPSAALPPDRPGHRQADVVLGDRWGAACNSGVRQLLRQGFERAGYRVALNEPYSGGHTTEIHGAPSRGLHVIQIELNRRLYMDETRLTRTSNLAALRDDICDILSRFAAGLPALGLDRPLRAAAE